MALDQERAHLIAVDCTFCDGEEDFFSVSSCGLVDFVHVGGFVVSDEERGIQGGLSGFPDKIDSKLHSDALGPWRDKVSNHNCLDVTGILAGVELDFSDDDDRKVISEGGLFLHFTVLWSRILLGPLKDDFGEG